MKDREILVLASSSPRRIEILKKLGLQFIVRKSEINEVRFKDETPERYVIRIAFEKAYNVAKKYNENTVIGADTIVLIDGEILGKPKNKSEAKNMLMKLSGREHKVLTGLCLLNSKSKKILKKVVKSLVIIKELTSEEIESYIKTGEPLDKAGSYAIQGIGAFMVKEIHGSYTNVVGLPVCELIEMLLEAKAIKRFP